MPAANVFPPLQNGCYSTICSRPGPGYLCRTGRFGPAPPPMKKFLIVEDELIPAYVLKTSLAQLGYHTVGLVADGAEALRAVLSLQPDLVFIDIRIEGPMTGFETVERLRQFSDIPVVYVGAYTDEATEQKAVQANCARLVTKPFNPHRLVETIAWLQTA